MKREIIKAIASQNVIEFYYEGELRIVEPHCYGITAAGNEGLRAYQIRGYSSSGKLGWKMYNLAKVEDVNITDDKFDGPRSGYQRGDKGMSSIHAEI